MLYSLSLVCLGHLVIFFYVGGVVERGRHIASVSTRPFPITSSYMYQLSTWYDMCW